MIGRREFIAGLGSTAAWSVVAQAQQAVMPVIGLLRFESLESMRDLIAAFHRGLADSGYVEVGIWQLNTALRRGRAIAYRRWPPIWFAVRWRLSPRLIAQQQRLLLRLPREPFLSSSGPAATPLIWAWSEILQGLMETSQAQHCSTPRCQQKSSKLCTNWCPP